MKNKKYYEIHRSLAVTLCLSVSNNPTQLTNLLLADMLEEMTCLKNIGFIVKEDHLDLEGNVLNNEKDYYNL